MKSNYFIELKRKAEQNIAVLQAHAEADDASANVRNACYRAIAVEEQTIKSCELALAKIERDQSHASAH